MVDTWKAFIPCLHRVANSNELRFRLFNPSWLPRTSGSHAVASSTFPYSTRLCTLVSQSLNLFQFRFADTEQYWSITLTFRNTVRRGTLLVERRSPMSKRDQGAIAVRHGTWCAKQGQLFGVL